MLHMNEGDATQAKLLQSIQRSVSSLTDMAQNAAEYARLTAMGTLEFAALDLRHCISTVRDDFELLLKERAIRFDFTAGPPAPADISPSIKEVFANLISNAIKYSPPDGTVGVRMEDQPQAWLVAVTDSGEGIPDKDKERVFNRFERLGKGGVQGSGLGLAIARQIVTMHHGAIWVEDAPDGGSVFLVRLPKVQPRSAIAVETGANAGRKEDTTVVALPLSRTRSAPGQAGAVAAATPGPRQNHILAALPVQDYERLLPHLEMVSLPLGWTADKRQAHHLYFPTTSIISRCHVTLEGAPTETALIGNEGMLGLTVFLTGETFTGLSVVVGAGYAQRLNVNVLKQDFALRMRLQSLALRYMQALIVQISQISVWQPAPHDRTKAMPMAVNETGSRARQRAGDDAADRLPIRWACAGRACPTLPTACRRTDCFATAAATWKF